MDIQAYINSGVLEEYCLGLLSEEDQAYLIQMSMLYPEIKDELAEVEAALEQLAQSGAIEPGLGVKQRILDMFGVREAGEPTDSHELPPISNDTDYQTWITALSHLISRESSHDLTVDLLKDDGHFRQMLVVAGINIPEEEHGEYLESFLILEGRCECTVGSSTYILSAGDFLEIPLHMKHDIKILTPRVVAVLQYEFV